MLKAFRRTVKGIIFKLGYQITRIPKNAEWRPGYTLHRYLKPDGSFDYERYRRIQTEGNKKKIDTVWVFEENVAFLSESATGRAAAGSRSGSGGISGARSSARRYPIRPSSSRTRSNGISTKPSPSGSTRPISSTATRSITATIPARVSTRG
jgi:hypothetical protein